METDKIRLRLEEAESKAAPARADAAEQIEEELRTALDEVGEPG